MTPRVHWHIEPEVLCQGSHTPLTRWQRFKALYEDLGHQIPHARCPHCDQRVEVAGERLNEVSCHETIVKCDLCSALAQGPGDPTKYNRGWRKILRGSTYRPQWGGRWACSQDCRDLIK